MLKLLFEYPRVDPNAFIGYYPALSFCPSPDTLKVFLQNPRVNVNAKTQRNSKTALHINTESDDRLACFSLLMKCDRVNISEVDGSGNQAVHYAAERYLLFD